MSHGDQRVRLAGGEADLAQQVVVLGGSSHRLTTKERDLLAYLAAHPGQTLSREKLLVEVWGYPAHASADPVYSTVKRLRAKIDGGAHRHVLTVHGEGYRYEPPPGPLQAPPGPASLVATGFVGRRDELDQVAELLQQGAALVTLVGPGGVGKTRLAREVARASLAPVTAWCDLSACADVGEVLGAVAMALDVPLDGPGPDQWRLGLGRALGARAGLVLVLDNAEQVVEEVAASVAAWAAQARFLVTSRERLRVPGEHLVRVEPLPMDDAVRLYLDRARVAGLSPEDSAVVRGLVEGLDRLPLAIELAAAQAPLLGTRVLLERLQQQLEALAVPHRGVPARHATLRAAVEWSWNLLTPWERSALSQLAVLQGPFEVDAAEAVVGEGGLAAVAALGERSVLRRVPVGPRPRFALFESVRELALENLVDAEETRLRHAKWFARRGEAWRARLHGADHAAAAEALRLDQHDLAAAVEHALTRDGDLGARLALVLERALGLHGSTSRARCALLERALGAVEAPGLRASLLLAEGRVEGCPPERARAGLVQALALARSGGDVRLEAEVLVALGRRRAEDADLAGAVEDCERALALAPSGSRLEGRALAALGEAHWTYGFVGRAVPLLERALGLHRLHADLVSQARTASLLGQCSRAVGRLREALPLLHEAEEVCAELLDPVGVARAQVERGLFLTRTGDHGAAREAMTEAGACFSRLGLLRDRAMLHVHLCEALVGMGDLERALEEVEQGVAGLRSLGAGVGLSVALEAQGCVQLLLQRPDRALASFDEGLALARAAGNTRSQATLLAKRGLVHLQGGAPPRALEDFEASRALHRDRGNPQMEGASLADLGLALAALGEEDESARAFERAEVLMGHPGPGHPDGRVLTICRVAARGLARRRRGEPGERVLADVRSAVGPILAEVSATGGDVPLRLAEWLVQLTGAPLVR